MNRLYAYASGITLATKDPWMRYLEDSFAADGFRVQALLKRIATSKTFYAVSPAESVAQSTPTAASFAAAD